MINERTTMRAIVVSARGELPKPKRVPIPTPGPEEVLVRVEACGLGLTVRDKLHRIAAELLPRIPGHEVAGSVVMVGRDVEDVAVGARVAAYYYLYCEECRQCRAGRQNLCRRRCRIGEHVDGGFAEFLVLPARNVVDLPARLDAVSATVACDAVGTAIHVCDRARIGQGSRVLILGAAGGVGAHLVQVARERGARVLGVDLGTAKTALLRELGAEAIDASTTTWWQDCAGVVDVAVDFIGTPEAFSRIYSVLDDGGTLVRMVTYKDVSTAHLSPPLGTAERAIMGSRYCTVAELKRAVELVAAGRVRAIIGRRVELEDVGRLFDDLDDGSLLGRGAVTISAD